MENNDLFLISDYFANDLSLAEQGEVKLRLKNDPEFLVLFNEQKEQLQVLKAIERVKTKENLRGLLIETQQKQSQTRNLWIISTIAASLLVLFLIVQFSIKSTLTPKQLAVGYLEPIPLSFERGEEKQNTLEMKAYQLYQQQNYASAIPLFQEMWDNDSDDAKITLYLGESLVQIGNYQAALAIFETLAKDSPYSDVAVWRLANIYLLEGNDSKAIPLLDSLSKSNHYKKAEAQELMRLLSDN